MPTPLGICLRNTLSIDSLVALARRAEERGYHSIWITEGTGSKDVISQMAAVAVATQRILIGSGIIPIWMRTPIILGASFLGLDELSKGRAIMGLGSGHPNAMRDFHGIEIKRSVPHMRDYVAIAKLLFKEKRFSYEGETARVTGYRRTVASYSDDIPIYIAALGPRMLRLAGECADGVLMNCMTPEHAAEAVKTVHAGSRAAGRDPLRVTIAAYIMTCMDDDEGRAFETVRTMVAAYSRDAFYNAMLRRAGFSDVLDSISAELEARDLKAAAARVPESMVDSMAVYGSEERCRSRLPAFIDAGIDLPVIHSMPIPGIDPWDEHAQLIDAFAPDRTGTAS
jgi:alkanesulfonate monooxygenase SsuD/methylene tetrahydromethanopterin reductase-like flavin-dependent oxidoreductase (luciferase family)